MTVDVVTQLEKASRQLSSSTATEDEQIEAIEIIEEYVDNMDAANDFCKIGGLEIILPCLSSEHQLVRAKTASLIAELAQNNPYCQKQLLDVDALPKLINLLLEPDSAPSAIHAISCSVRNFEPALAAFIDIGGLECILGCLQRLDEEKVIVRSLFLLSSISAEFPPVRDELIKLRAVDQIVAMLRPSSEYDVRLETALSALCLFTENQGALLRCQESELGIHKTLNDIQVAASGNPACSEIIDYCKTLQSRVYSSKQETTDRWYDNLLIPFSKTHSDHLGLSSDINMWICNPNKNL